MKVSVDFGRWTRTKAAMAVAGALAVAGAVGSALAISPIIAPPIKWQGGAEFQLIANSNALIKAYTVPAGRNFLLTDLTISNFDPVKSSINIYSGAAGVCDISSLTTRVQSLLVPPETNTVLAFQTGIGFGAGQAVCILPSAPMTFNGRGFLFTPAPAT